MLSGEGNENSEKTTMVVYHLPKFSGKSGWKVNGTRLLFHSIEKFPGQRNIWKGSPVFPEGIFQTEFVFHFLKPSLKPGSPLRGLFSVNETHVYKWQTRFPSLRDSGTRFTSPKFCVPFVQTVVWSVCRVNGKCLISNKKTTTTTTLHVQHTFFSLLLFCLATKWNVQKLPGGYTY